MLSIGIILSRMQPFSIVFTLLSTKQSNTLNMKKIITLFVVAFAICSIKLSAQCVMTGNAAPSACSPTTNTYSVNGFVGYANPPATGTLVITSSCGGSPVTLLPPFTGSSTYTIPGITANGASCSVLFYFSDLPTCMYSAMYTAPAACGATSLAESAFVSNIAISPNPTNSTINLSFEQSQSQAVSIEIVDVLGKVIYNEELQKFIGSYNKKIDLATFNKGVYFVRIAGANGSETRKIIYY